MEQAQRTAHPELPKILREHGKARSGDFSD